MAVESAATNAPSVVDTRDADATSEAMPIDAAGLVVANAQSEAAAAAVATSASSETPMPAATSAPEQAANVEAVTESAPTQPNTVSADGSAGTKADVAAEPAPTTIAPEADETTAMVVESVVDPASAETHVADGDGGAMAAKSPEEAATMATPMQEESSAMAVEITAESAVPEASDSAEGPAAMQVETTEAPAAVGVSAQTNNEPEVPVEASEGAAADTLGAPGNSATISAPVAPAPAIELSAAAAGAGEATAAAAAPEAQVAAGIASKTGSTVTQITAIAASGPSPGVPEDNPPSAVPQLDGGADSITHASTRGPVKKQSKQIKIRPLSKLASNPRRPSSAETEAAAPAPRAERSDKGKRRAKATVQVSPKEEEEEEEEEEEVVVEKSYVCTTPGCARQFANMNGLNHHIISGGCRTIIGNTAVDDFDSKPEYPGKVLRCEWAGCPLGFNTRRALAQHLGDDHATQQDFRAGCRWAKCPKIGAEVTRRTNLMSHLSTHIGLARFISVTSFRGIMASDKAAQDKRAAEGRDAGGRAAKRLRTDVTAGSVTISSVAHGAASASASVDSAAHAASLAARASATAASAAAGAWGSTSSSTKKPVVAVAMPTVASTAQPAQMHAAVDRAPRLTETDRHVVRQKLLNANTLKEQVVEAGAATVVSDIRQDHNTAVAVRLTAALILRNLVVLSSNRSRLMLHETRLFNLAARDSNLQAILSTVLAVLNSSQATADDASPTRGWQVKVRSPSRSLPPQRLSFEAAAAFPAAAATGTVTVASTAASGQCTVVDDVPRVAPTRDHTGKSVYLCQTCGKGFATNFVMKRHARMHSNVKNFACPVCRKEFNRKDAMKQHAQVHDKPGGW